jgi:molybdenum cofactor cytidylyltransferase
MTAAVVLAAGAGTRMGGQAKALLHVGDTTFVERIVATARARGVPAIVVVAAGVRAEIAARLAADPAALVIENPHPERGQLSSLKLGLARVPAGAHALVWPVDHPTVAQPTVDAILRAGEDHPGCAIVPRFHGCGGHPMLLPSELHAALRALPDELGARELYRRHPESVFQLAVEDPGVCADVDTPADYQRFIG